MNPLFSPFALPFLFDGAAVGLWEVVYHNYTMQMMLTVSDQSKVVIELAIFWCFRTVLVYRQKWARRCSCFFFFEVGSQEFTDDENHNNICLCIWASFQYILFLLRYGSTCEHTFHTQTHQVYKIFRTYISALQRDIVMTPVPM